MPNTPNVPRNHPDYMKLYRALNPGKFYKANQSWALKNKIHKNRQWREWSKRNRQSHLANCKKYYLSKIDRMPDWGQSEEIRNFYKNAPPGYHVDHIIPLRGKTVSGLHVLENLQYLPAKENLQKGNKW